MSLIFGRGYAFWFNFLFRFLKLFIKHTWFYLGLGCAKDGSPHSGSSSSSTNHSRSKHSTSFLKNSLCTFSTGYGREHIGFTFYFNLKSTWSVFQVPSVPSNNSSIFVINLAICYIVFLSDVDIDFPWPYVNLTFPIWHIILHVIF